jgi:hypothetical protein
MSAILVAWLGTATVAVSDGRRAFALGLTLTGLGLAGMQQLVGNSTGAAVLLAGGVGAGALRLRDGPAGWGVLPPGSSPRIILSLVTLAFGAFVGISLTTGPGAPGRVATVAVCALSFCRLLSAERQAVAGAVAPALSLALGTMGDSAAQAVGAAVAVVLSAVAAARPASTRPTDLAGRTYREDD